MATKLKNLQLTSVDLVRAGANQEADIMLHKSAAAPEAPEYPTEPEKNILKRFIDWLTKNPQEAEIEEHSAIQKADETVAIYKNAIIQSIQSIIQDDTLSTEQKNAMVEKSIGQYHDKMAEIAKFNPYHGSDGRFASANSATSMTYAPGKSKAHDNAIAREKEKGQAAGGGAKEEPKNVSPTSTGGKLVDQGGGQLYGENDNGMAVSVLDGGKSDINYYKYGSKQIYEVQTYNADGSYAGDKQYVPTKAEAKKIANSYLKANSKEAKTHQPEIFDIVGYLSQGMTINAQGKVVPARKSAYDEIEEIEEIDE